MAEATTELAETVTLTIAPDWDWDQCTNCGSPEVAERRWTALNDGSLARVGWCPRAACLSDLSLTRGVVAEHVISPVTTGGPS